MPAVSSPLDSSGISVTKYYCEICKSSLVLAPPTFEFSGDPQKLLGEMAEKKVIDSTCVFATFLNFTSSASAVSQ